MMELSILAYARYHGVSRDHLGLDPLSFMPDSPTDSAVSLDDPDDPSLLTVKSAQLTASQGQREKLDITKSGAIFLTSILQAPTILEKAGSEIHWDGILPDHGRIKRLKVEEPLLNGDHELDMREFRNQTNINQVDVEISVEQLDDENDEGLGFPRYCRDLASQMHDQITREKFDCPREVLHFMQGIKQSLSSSIEDAHQEVYDCLNWSPTEKCEPITPPLLLREHSPVPFIPAPWSLELELFSEIEPRALPEYESVDRLLAEDFEIDNGSAGESAEETPGKSFLVSLGYSPSMPPNPNTLISPKRPLPDDLKVDTPITPPISSKKRRPEEQKKVLDDLLQDMSFRPWPALQSEHEHLLEGKLDKAAQCAKIEVEDRLKTEYFRQIEPSVRANVPYLETPDITPPWVNIPELPANLQHAVRRLISKLIVNQDLTSDFRMEPQDERLLSWNPFPGGIKSVIVEETIDSAHKLEEFLVTMDIEVEGGNHILFFPTRLPAPQDDMDSEVLSRGFTKELNADRSNHGFTHGHLRPVTDHALKFGSKADPGLQNDQEGKSISRDGAREVQRGHPNINPQSPSVFGSKFSTRGQLAKFMNIRGQRGSESDGPNFGSSLSEPNNNHQEQQQPYSGSKSIDATVDLRDLILPIPDIPSPPTPKTLVISCSLLRSHLGLVRDLEALVPPAVLIFRDQSKPIPSHPTGKILQSSSTISPGSSNGNLDGSTKFGDEADIILSPTVGILLTTTQETTQLYLPGHHTQTNLGVKCDSPLRERISSCCVRYEQIYLLIYDPPQANRDKLTMDSRTVDSVRSLQSFCHILRPHCLITLLLVPDSLTDWITGLSNEHTFTLPSWVHSTYPRESSLLSPEDPTPSELTLQQAGLNPFAAQVVLYLCSFRELGATVEEFPFGERKSGLQAPINRNQMLQVDPQDAFKDFVGMNPYERRQRFASILGNRVLSRVEKQLSIIQGVTR